MIKNAVAYIRVSSDGQEEMYGQEMQKKAIEQYAKDNGYNIVSWHYETGSGAKERPILESIVMGTVITNPPVDAVIVYKTDRVARDMKLYFYYLFLLEKKNIKLLSVNESFDGVDASLAGVYRALLQFVAEQERKNIVKRTTEGRKVKAQQGGYSGGRVPYGYSVDNGKLVVNESEAEIVKALFADIDAGLSLQKVTDHLADMGYRTRKGTNFAISGVVSIRDNRKFYEGYYRFGEMDWVKGEHQPLLDGKEN